MADFVILKDRAFQKSEIRHSKTKKFVNNDNVEWFHITLVFTDGTYDSVAYETEEERDADNLELLTNLTGKDD